MADFQKGDFRSYKARTKVHMAAFGGSLEEDSVIETDGFTVKFAGEAVVMAAIQTAIRDRWFVPVDSDGGVYTPAPAVDSFSSAVPDRMGGRKKFSLEVAEEDSFAVGTVANAHLATGSQRSRDIRAAQAQGDGVAVAFLPPTKKNGKDSRIDVSNSPSPDKLLEQREREGLKRNMENRRRLQGSRVGVDGLETPREAAPRQRVGVDGFIPEDPAPQVRAQDQDADYQEFLAWKRSRQNAVAPAPAPVVAKTPDLQGWVEANKDAHWKTRIVTALDEFGDRPDVLKKLGSIESPGVAKAIDKYISENF